MKTETNIRKSLRLIQTEKMLIILKELTNIKKILEFFYGYDDFHREEPETKPIKRNIRFLLEDIEALHNKIERLQKINQNLKGQETMLFLIQYDHVRIEIEDMLHVIQALYHKMQQLFGETLNQYLPYPVFGRRFSNSGIMMYLNNYFRELHKSLSKDNKPPKNLMLSWNYRTGFQYRIFLNREIKRDNYKQNTYNNYIDLPYWYYELPMLLPAITHEVGYISLRHPSEPSQSLYNSLEKTIYSFLHNPKNNFVQKVQDIIGYEAYSADLTRVILGDVIAYQIHGSSYIHALFHNIIGEKLSPNFLKLLYDNKGKADFLLLPNEWLFSQKKDHSILRLYFMLSFIGNEKYYEEMYDLLLHIMPLLDQEGKSEKKIHGFNEVYKYNYPNYYNSYKSVQNYLSQLLYTLLAWKDEHNTELKQIQDIDNAPNFKLLWDERFEQLKNSEEVMHQNNFRREIHKKISNVEFLKNFSKDESIIYLMELGKARKDVGRDANILELIQNELKEVEESTQPSSESIKLQLTVYGIYDWVTLKKKSITINVVETLNKLLKREESDSKRLKYFTTKQVLMKMTPTIKGDLTRKENSDFSVIFNIEVAKNIDYEKCSNGYDDLTQSITRIDTKLKKHKEMFTNANIFKSLGPKDLTVIIEETNLNHIFKLLEMINQENYRGVLKKERGAILRTFTIICSPFNKEITIKSQLPNEKFALISYLRISNDFDRNKRTSLIEKEHMASFTEVTGVMDFRIQWKEETSVTTVIDYYNRKISDQCLTDFQTKIEKVLL